MTTQGQRLAVTRCGVTGLAWWGRASNGATHLDKRHQLLPDVGVAVQLELQNLFEEIVQKRRLLVHNQLLNLFQQNDALAGLCIQKAVVDQLRDPVGRRRAASVTAHDVGNTAVPENVAPFSRLVGRLARLVLRFPELRARFKVPLSRRGNGVANGCRHIPNTSHDPVSHHDRSGTNGGSHRAGLPFGRSRETKHARTPGVRP